MVCERHVLRTWIIHVIVFIILRLMYQFVFFRLIFHFVWSAWEPPALALLMVDECRKGDHCQPLGQLWMRDLQLSAPLRPQIGREGTEIEGFLVLLLHAKPVFTNEGDDWVYTRVRSLTSLALIEYLIYNPLHPNISNSL
jgi:hypothetical protein